MSEQQQPSEFGTWLIEARGRAGMTRPDLWEASGVHVNTIRKLESGETQRPSAQVAAKLKATLGQQSAPEEVRAKFDRHTQAFLDLLGGYLMTLPEERRLERIFELASHVIDQPRQVIDPKP